jgi:transposase
VNRYRTEHAGEEPPLTMTERTRLRELERENRELKMKAEFWGKRRPSSPRSISERSV